MKKIFTISFVVIIGLLVTTNLFAQTAASATWSLLSNQIPALSGNITATNESLGSALLGVLYNSTFKDSNNPCFGSGWHRVATTNGSQLPASYSATSYVEYTVSPVTGNDLTINSVTFSALGGGTSNVKIAVYYSLDGFATSNALGTATLGTTPVTTSPATTASPIAPQNSSNSSSTGAENISFSPSILAVSGKTLSVRIFAWSSS